MVVLMRPGVVVVAEGGQDGTSKMLIRVNENTGDVVLNGASSTMTLGGMLFLITDPRELRKRKMESQEFVPWISWRTIRLDCAVRRSLPGKQFMGSRCRIHFQITRLTNHESIQHGMLLDHTRYNLVFL